MSTLSVVIPKALTSSQLISSSVPENDYPAWASGTTYAKDAFVISATTHRVYQSMQASNLGKDPTDVKNRSGSTVYWLDIGPTNRWAMLDSEVSTATQAETFMTVILRPGIFNTMFWAGLDADTLAVTVRASPGGETVLDGVYPLEGSTPGDYDEYFWDPFKPLSDFLLSGIEQYGDAEVTFTLSKGSGTVKCGMLLIGDRRDIGKTLAGVKVKPRTYSFIKTDEFGATKIVRRKATTDMSLSAFIPPAEAEQSVRIIQDALDVVALWIGSELPQYGTLRVIGLGSGEVTYLSPSQCQLSLDVQGVISTST